MKTLITLAILLLGVTPAWAETWVVWSRGGTGFIEDGHLKLRNPDRWTPVSTLPSKADCVKLLERIRKTSVAQRPDTIARFNETGTELTLVEPGVPWKIVIQNACWPVGVNP